MKTIINLTPHILNIFDNDNNVVNIPPSGIVARRATSRVSLGDINNIPVNKTTLSEIIYEDKEKNPVDFFNDPEAVYVVSAICLGADAPNNFYSPGELVRNEQGQPVGARGLSQ